MASQTARNEVRGRPRFFAAGRRSSSNSHWVLIWLTNCQAGSSIRLPFFLHGLLSDFLQWTEGLAAATINDG